MPITRAMVIKGNRGAEAVFGETTVMPLAGCLRVYIGIVPCESYNRSTTRDLIQDLQLYNRFYPLV
jgi:hypothetical protein